MSVSLAEAVVPRVRRLDWDTAHFGFGVARLEQSVSDPQVLRAVLGGLRSAGIRLVYLLCDAAEIKAVRAAEACGFGLVDVRVVYRAPAAAAECSLPGGFALRPGRPSDLDALTPLAAGTYTASRFYADPRISRAQADLVYVRWLQTALTSSDHHVLAAWAGERPAGYVAVKLPPDGPASIALVAVARQERGRGLGEALVRSAVSLAAAEGRAAIEVGTHGREAAVQRLYQRCGFTLRSTGLWYHAWLDAAGRSQAPA